MNINFGVYLPTLPVDMFIDTAIQADTLGYDSIWLSDHLVLPFPPAFPDFPGNYEAWTTASYLAGLTKNVKLSHQVLVGGFRHPGVLAHMAATLDQLSGGRFILTTGAGWFRSEFDAYNIPFDKHDARIAREREIIEIIKALWAGGSVSYDGKYYQLKEAVLQLKLCQKPRPKIWIGGDSKQTMQLAADEGDGWLMHGHTPEEVARMISSFDTLSKGRAKNFSFATSLFIALGNDKNEAEQKFHQILPDHLFQALMRAPTRLELRNRICGTVSDCQLIIKQFAKSGLNYIVLMFVDPADIALFSREVLPEFKQFPRQK